jgi:hypothetical protein
MTTNQLTFSRLVSEAMSIEGMTRAEAERAVARKFPQFAPVPPQTGAAAGGSAERELDQRARELAARDRITYAVAYTRVLNSDPSLYLAYLKEHEAKLDSGARRG